MAFTPKINDHVKTRQMSAAKIKLTKAMEVMMTEDNIGPYYSDTKDFVDNLQKYFKIAKICDKDHLKDCFGYDTITIDDKEKADIQWLTDGSLFASSSESSSDNFSGDSVGIITIDGTSMLLAWNKNCPILPPSVYEWSGDTNVTTNCIAAIMDVNGDRGPNRKNKDITTLNARLGCGVKFEYDGTKYCWDEPFRANVPLTDADCAENKAKYGITNCVPIDDEQFSNKDYWGGAMKSVN